MDEKCGYKTPTPADSLEQQIIDPSFPKNEREWWASEEITRLRAEVEALKAENAALASWQCLFTDGTTTRLSPCGARPACRASKLPRGSSDAR